MKASIAASIFALTLSGCAIEDMLVGYSVEDASQALGEPVLASPKRWYWCKEGAHGYKRISSAGVYEGILTEQIEFRIFYEGDCSKLAEYWDRERWDTYN